MLKRVHLGALPSNRLRAAFGVVGTALALFGVACISPPAESPFDVVEFELVAAPSTVPLVDGRQMEVWAYDGQVPGPTIRVRRGQTLRVRFTNRLPQPTTVHWHGVRVPNAMDGVPGVTQPQVEPGESFTYEFAPPDAGTFWFHPHVRSSEQVERGLFGVLIVEDPEPPPFSREEVWVLDDLLLARDGRIAPEFNTRHDLAHDGRWGNVVMVNGERAPTLEVKPGERIRLRLLNVANGRVFVPDFGELEPRVIAVDGLYAKEPVAWGGFEIAPGNRVDLDLVVPPDAGGRRFAVQDRFTRRPFPIAEIAVSGDRVETPAFPAPARAAEPAWGAFGESAPARAELRLNARLGGPLGIEWTINDEVMDHAHDHAKTGRYALPRNEASRLRFVNDSYRLHPMHLHGMFFRVLSRNGVAVDEPFSRDTVLVHPKETVEVGVVPADPGLWMAHCHVLEHAEAGMMTLVEVR
ncbi:MAG: multicopper oxidase family protein [Deltaproteobacteria bacterium]|nr:multicopper oxidase family protein [Deltaproteobacteria bacterium]